MRLILTRHGETEENIKRIIQGKAGGKLTAKGIEEAKKLAIRLKKEKIDRIYVSDLKRTVDTAKEIIKYHPKAKVTHTKALRERNFGVLEGKTYEDVREAAKKAGWPKGVDYTPEGGESNEEILERVTKLITKIMKTKDKTVLLVSHGGPIRHYLLQFLEGKHKCIHDNCAVTILEINEKGHKIETLACTKHLAE